MEELVARLVEQNAALIAALQQNVQQQNVPPPQAQPLNVVIPASINITIDKFNAESGESTDARLFLESINTAADINAWPNEQRLHMAKSSLTGAARDWMIANTDQLDTWANFERQFRATFLSAATTAERWQRLKSCKQKQNESVFAYFHRKIKHCVELELPWTEQCIEVIEGIRSPELVNFLLPKQHGDQNELYQSIQMFERIMSNRRANTSTERSVAAEKPRSSGSKVSKDVTVAAPDAKTKTIVCFRCREEGHVVRDCPKPDERRCHRCKQEGHTVRNCPVKNETVNLVMRPTCSTVEKYLKEAFVNGDKRKAFIDPGSSICLIKKSKLPDNSSLDVDGAEELRGFTGSKDMSITTLGSTYLDVEIDEVMCRDVPFAVLDDRHLPVDTIIGRTWTERDNVCYVKMNNDLTIHDVGNPLLKIDPFICSVMPLHEEFIPIKDPIHRDELNCGPMVDDEKKDELCTVVNEYRDCFAKNLSELGLTDKITMNIELTTPNAPINQKPYRVSQTDREDMKRIIREYRQLGIVTDTSSTHASPALIVKKKSGESRMVIDYRRLNTHTKVQPYPLPIIDDLIPKICGGTLFTSLDLASGYLQIPLTPSAREKTAFITPDERGEFTRMTFGLKNAPFVFTELMNKICGTVPELINYFDDILFAATNWEEFLRILRLSLESMRAAKLTLKLTKCTFAQNTVEFLGFRFEKGLYKPGDDKILAVERFPRPKDAHDVRRFIGLCSFFRRFVKGFAQLAAPLTDLTRKSVDFGWTEKHEEAFRELKLRLIEKPILRLFDRNAETELHTDASNLGIGSILLQRSSGGVFQPVHYLSKKLSDSERNYHSSKLELLAVVWSINRLYNWLIDVPFTVKTDCAALQYLNQHKTLNPQVARWFSFIQEFDINIQYRPSQYMQHADALSRAPYESGDDILTLLIENRLDVCAAVNENDRILMFQRVDEDLSTLFKLFDKPITELTRLEEKLLTKYKVAEGLLYRRIDDRYLLVIPAHARKNILVKTHDMSGHFSVDKTLAKIRERYYFPRMKNYVKQHIRGCIDCLFLKDPGGKRSGQLHPIPAGRRPFATIHIDHYGPLERTMAANSMILVVICNLTKYVKLYPMKSANTSDVITALSEFSLNYGLPERIICDQGTCFTAVEFVSWCELHAVRLIHNAVNHPRANGQVERVNRFLQPLLVVESFSRETWDEQLPVVEKNVNNSICKSTGMTPFKAVFGYSPEFNDGPIRSRLIRGEEWRPPAEVQAEVRIRLEEQKRKMKERFDQSHTSADKLKVGEVVVRRVRDTARDKMSPKYDGPFEVIGVRSDDTYKIRSLHPEAGGLVTDCHIGVLKCYRGNEEITERPLRLRKKPARFGACGIGDDSTVSGTAEC